MKKIWSINTPSRHTGPALKPSPTQIDELVFLKKWMALKFFTILKSHFLVHLKSHFLVQVCWNKWTFQCTHVLRWRKKTPFCCLRFVSLCNSTHVFLVTYFLLFVGFPTFSMMTFPWLPWSIFQTPRSSFTFVASRGTNSWLVVFGSTNHGQDGTVWCREDVWSCR